MTEIKRYDVWQEVLLEREDGDWVAYDDHAAELATLRAEVERMRRALGNIVSMESVPGNIMVTAIAAIAKDALK